MMNKEQKKNYITEMTNQFENSKAIMVTHYQGLKMTQLDAFGEDAIMSARILSKFSKDNENLKLIGGIMDNEVLDQAGVLNVANLPTLNEARANIVGILNASASKLVSILLARSEKISNLPPENSETKPKE